MNYNKTDPHTINILILGGISDAVSLTQQLIKSSHTYITTSATNTPSATSTSPIATPLQPKIKLIYSLAGLSANPKLPSLPKNLGKPADTKPIDIELTINKAGFSTPAKLCRYIDENHIGLIINACQPYAQQISKDTLTASRLCKVKHIRYLRKAWPQHKGDNWFHVKNLDEALTRATSNYHRIFLASGINKIDHKKLLSFINPHGKAPTSKQPETSPDQMLLLRSISRPNTELLTHPNIKWLQYHSPPSLAEEITLLRKNQIEVIISKNSGGELAYQKIAAANQLKLPLIMINRPTPPKEKELTSTYHDLGEVINATLKHITTLR